MKVNAAECHQDGLLWINQDILKRHLSFQRPKLKLNRGHWRPLCLIWALRDVHNSADVLTFSHFRRPVPVHLNCFHHRSHSAVLYKEGEASSHSERPCLYMPFVVRLKGVRKSLRRYMEERLWYQAVVYTQVHEYIK